MNFRHNDAPTYDPQAIQPFRDELVAVGFKETHTPEEFENTLNADPEKTTLVVVNSVCGCSAGSLRPGVSQSLQNLIIPDNLVTVFAGQEKSALAHIRSTYLSNYAPSSPNALLFKGGKLLSFLPRETFQEHTQEDLSQILSDLFNKHCMAVGPSTSPENFEKLKHAISCGSKIPRFDGQEPSC